MNTKIYFLTFFVLLCVSCKDRKSNIVQTIQNVSSIDTTIQKIAENVLHITKQNFYDKSNNYFFNPNPAINRKYCLRSKQYGDRQPADRGAAIC